MRDIVDRFGEGAVGELLAAVAVGRSFESAFSDSTGVSLDAALASFWRRELLWHRWLPVITSTTTLWLAITLLMLYAARKRRRRDRELTAIMEAEERLAETEPSSTVH